MAACVHGRSPLGACGICSPPRVEPSKWRWLESTVDLQREAFGDHDIPKKGETLADSVMMNATALASELHEALAEVGWKPWATPRGWLNRDAYLRELVDVGHFLANLLVAVGCTDDEWEMLYRAKQRVNRERQERGYDGVSSKCPRCKRALDEVGVGQQPHPQVPNASVFVCGGCGSMLATEFVLGPEVTAKQDAYHAALDAKALFTHIVPTAEAERVLRDDPPPPMPQHPAS